MNPMKSGPEPDSNGHANVLISTYDPNGKWICLGSDVNHGITMWDTCDSTNLPSRRIIEK